MVPDKGTWKHDPHFSSTLFTSFLSSLFSSPSWIFREAKAISIVRWCWRLWVFSLAELGLQARTTYYITAIFNPHFNVPLKKKRYLNTSEYLSIRGMCSNFMSTYLMLNRSGIIDGRKEKTTSYMLATHLWHNRSSSTMCSSNTYPHYEMYLCSTAGRQKCIWVVLVFSVLLWIWTSHLVSFCVSCILIN